MKKVVAIVLAVIMVASLSLIVFAGPGSFVKSPSLNGAPELMDGSRLPEGCDGYLLVTPYAKRKTLPEETKKMLESAYDQIVATKDLTTLSTELAKLAQSLNIPGEQLAVSDLFDVSVFGCTKHEYHFNYYIRLKADTFKNFVGLMHLNGDTWELVKDAKLEENGKVLTFTAKNLSPFAVVVDTDPTTDPTPTGDNTQMILYVFIMAASAVAIVVLWGKSKKYSH